MKPLFHPQAVNGPFEDPVLFVDMLFERRALLFDLGDITALEPRKLLRITDVFVSHAHMDHFAGFDHLLRIRLGRPQPLRLYGPPGFIDRVGHKLGGYTWNLVRNYEHDFTITVTELVSTHERRSARFRCRAGFAREEYPAASLPEGILLDEPGFEVRTVVLDHRIPCLGFALQEHQHINIWKDRLQELGLPTGPWLRDLKARVRAQEPDHVPFRVWWKERGRLQERHYPLGFLKERVIQITKGQKLAFIVDAVYDEDNARRIESLARGADMLFIEAPFLERDALQAQRKCHLTARQAGELARRADVKSLIPFHFSARYQDTPDAPRMEAMAAFLNAPNADKPSTGRMFDQAQ